ncbi:DinB family protein [Aurantibacillus circumpalustris]|uniref:DinB family protein n=1 Tax=Aurantibacillus circumpalustris TaxID=3036359 RepID=UPI00295BFD53|nr:DinB family protein [Aurantibacillus circumpalustris]
MTKGQFIADRLREVYLNGKWIANTNYKEQLLSINWQQATQKIESLNTIAALTFHINYYLQGLLPVLNGGKLEISDKFSFDLPQIQSEKDWNKLVNEFLFNAEKFADRVEKLSDKDLNKIFVEEKYGTYQRNVEVVIEHSYYHLGQISLIKKMIQGNNSN